jgi:hypothetical protein
MPSMTGLLDIVRFGGQTAGLNIRANWLQPLAELAGRWHEVAGQISTLAAADIHSFDGLMAFLLEHRDDPAVKQAFAALGLDPLERALEQFHETYAALPDEVKRLCAPLSAAAQAGPIELPLGTLSGQQDLGAGKSTLALEAAADASLACAPAAAWSVDADGLPAGLIALTLTGHLGATGNGKVPFRFGSAGASAQAALACELSYFHRPPASDPPFAAALVSCLPDLPVPFELAPIWASMIEGRLEGLRLAIEGHSQVELDISIGQSADLPKVLFGTLGITGKVGLKRKGSYSLSIHAAGSAEHGDRHLVVALSHDRANAASWGVGVGLELDLAPLLGRLHAVLVDALGTWSDELERLKPFLHPGTWIAEHLQPELEQVAAGLLQDGELREALTQDLGLLFAPVESADSKLAKALAERIGGKIGEVAGVASDGAEEKAREIVARLCAALPALVRDPVREKLEEGIASLIGSFRTELDRELNGIVGSVKPKKIGEALNEAGLEVEGALHTADEALSGLRRLLERFDALFHELVLKTEESAKKKVGAQLAFEEAHESGFELDVLATIDALTPEAEAIVRALARGDWVPVQRLLASGGAVPGLTLDPQRSSLALFSRVSRKTGFAFVLFGLEMSAQELLSAEAEIVALGNGVIAVAARGELAMSKEGPREGRSAGLVSGYDLLLAKAQEPDAIGAGPAPQRSIALGVTATHKDKSLKAVEVTGFLRSLSGVGLISQERVDRAQQVYESWPVTPEGDAPAGDIAVTMRLGEPGLRRLLELGRDITRELAADAPQHRTRRCFEVALDAMLSTGRLDEDELSHALRDPQAQAKFRVNVAVSDREWLLLFLLAVRRAGGVRVERHRERVGAVLDDEGPRFSSIVNAMRAMSALADMLQLMAAIYDAEPARGTHEDGWTQKDYRRAEEHLAAAAREWLGLNSKWIFWFSQGMGKKTAALLLALAALSQDSDVASVGQGADSLFSITLTPRVGPAETQMPVAL